MVLGVALIFHEPREPMRGQHLPVVELAATGGGNAFAISAMFGIEGLAGVGRGLYRVMQTDHKGVRFAVSGLGPFTEVGTAYKAAVDSAVAHVALAAKVRMTGTAI